MPLVFSTEVPEATEKEGFPTENWSDGAVEAQTTLLCPWIKRHDLVTDLLDNALPFPHLPILRAKGAGISPHSTRVTSDGQGCSYEMAEVNVTYGSIEFIEGTELTGATIFSEELTPNGEMLTCDHTSFAWGSASGTALKKEEAPAKMILGVDFNQTQYRMTSLHVDLIGLINHCNSAPVTATMLGLTFPAQTLMYAGSSPQRTVTQTGAGKWTVQKRFCYRKDGWNKFWRPGNATTGEGFYEIWKVGGSRFYVAPLASFSNILV